MTEPTPTRFRISWDGGAYYVSIPNYHGGEVVPATVVDIMAEALEAARRQIVTLGGDHHLNEQFGDKIHASVLAEIDAALALAAPPVEQAKTEVEG